MLQGNLPIEANIEDPTVPTADGIAARVIGDQQLPYFCIHNYFFPNMKQEHSKE
jgi:hypothetical protein